MNILFIVPYTPNLIRTRPYNLIRSLAHRGHTLTVATLWETEQERAWLDRLAGNGIRVISARLTRARSAANAARALISGTPIQYEYCWQPWLANTLARSVRSGANGRRRSANGDGRNALDEKPFDLVHVEHLRGARYGLHVKSAIRNPQSSVPVVWDSVDCISLLFEQAARNSRSPFGRWAARIDLPRTRRYEGLLVRRFDRVLTTSVKDKCALERLAGHGAGSKVAVLTNGVDLEDFSPGPAPRSSDTVILTGKMSYHANVTAALHLVNDIMPRVWARRPDVRVAIVGSAPAPEVRALAARHSPRVSVTGHVPDLRPHLRSAALAVAPVPYGAGIQNKVLEAMACGTPVLASPQAVSALQARAGEDLRVAESASAFADEMLHLLDDESLRRRIGDRGRRYICAQHDWSTVAGQLEGIYHELLGTTP